MQLPTITSLRHTVYDVLEDDDEPSYRRHFVDATLATAIIVAVGAAILETVPSLDARFHWLFDGIEFTAGLLFTAEYILRLWSIVEDRAGRYRTGWRGRLRFALTPMALIDLVAILPFLLSFILPQSLLFLRAMRLVRILKLARYSPAIGLFEIVIYNQRSALAAVAMMIGAAVITLSSLAYMAEGRAQPEAFGTIPDAMWWTVITMTTVGYGDVTPVTGIGRLVAALTSFLGISMFAFPTAILGAGFAEELRKRDFNRIVEIIAKLPAFQHLGAHQLSEIAGRLHFRQLPPRYHVLRRGEHADSMYFIDKGEVVVRLEQQSLHLEEGDFFGEIALLLGGRRVATATTLTACDLLELRASDFHQLIQRDPKLREILQARMTGRVGT